MSTAAKPIPCRQKAAIAAVTLAGAACVGLIVGDIVGISDGTVDWGGGLTALAAALALLIGGLLVQRHVARGVVAALAATEAAEHKKTRAQIHIESQRLAAQLDELANVVAGALAAASSGLSAEAEADRAKERMREWDRRLASGPPGHVVRMRRRDSGLVEG